jgi:hypothetical protein
MMIEHSLVAIVRIKKNKKEQNEIPTNYKRKFPLTLCSEAIKTVCQRSLAKAYTYAV